MNSEIIYKKILEISDNNMISKPYVVGGIPRDLLISGEKEYKDIDITTNGPDVVRLALLLADNLGVSFEMFKDGHISIFLKGYSVDFSSNFISEDAIEYAKEEIAEKESLKEVFSRDFTINTLLLDIETGEVTDPTGRGRDDLSNKTIKSIVSPEITFNDDPNRIFRAIELSTRLGFDIDGEILDFARSNSERINTDLAIKEAFIEGIISKSLKNDADKTLEYLIQMDLLKQVPLTGMFKDQLISRRMIKDYLDL